MNEPRVAVLCGGTSAEREVSLGSGKACAEALAQFFPTRLIVVDRDEAPAELEAGADVAFLAFHGGFGEGGGMQRALDQAGVVYAGCDAASSALCLDKLLAKRAVAARGVFVAPDLAFDGSAKPGVEEIVAKLGEEVVIKPNADGSSVGLALCASARAIADKLGDISSGRWLAERRVLGRELSVGVLGGRALGVVEIAPKSGVYDYASKYTKGMTEYFAPARIDPGEAALARQLAETSFAACGCRDYARVDMILTERGALFLEVNTLPGMKETSLLPMSARCAGYDFPALCRELVAPALARFRAAQPTRRHP